MAVSTMASIGGENGTCEGIFGRAVHHTNHALKVGIIVDVNRKHRTEQLDLHGFVHRV